MTETHKHEWVTSEPCRHGDYRRMCVCGISQLLDINNTIVEVYDRRRGDRRQPCEDDPFHIAQREREHKHFVIALTIAVIVVPVIVWLMIGKSL